MAHDDDLVGWALSARIESSRQVGADRCRVVLIVLARHAGRDRICWPGAQTIADQVDGLTRRPVRDALDQLEQLGLITRDGVVGRAVRYRLNAAGIPATSPPTTSAGIPATDVAGALAGALAGGSAGTPAPNRTEPEQALSERPKTMAKPTRFEMPSALARFVDLYGDRAQEAYDQALRRYNPGNPDAYFRNWTDDQIQERIRLGKPTTPLHTAPWCGHCDSEKTRRLEDEHGNLIPGPDGKPQRCHCWTPRTAAT